MTDLDQRVAIDPDSARGLLETIGGLDDCNVEQVIQNFQSRQVEVFVDDFFRGVDGANSTPGSLLFLDVEYSLCRIPFVGGRVRVETCEVGSRQGKIQVSISLTTTKWLDCAEFGAIEIVVVCGALKARIGATSS